MLRFGYKASAEQFAPRALLDFAILAEKLGFDSCYVSDHFQPWRHTGGHAPFSLAWMAALGERTQRMTIGTSVLTPTFRYHPSIVAQAMATLASLYPNRIVLGVGTGESLNEVPSTGLEWPGFKEREGRLREAVELMRRLWTEDRVTHHGTYYETRNATIYDKPPAPLPIFMGASGPKAAFMAGELGDGFICTSGKNPALYRDTLMPNLEAGRKAAGHSMEGLDLMIEMKVSFDTDYATALENTRYWAALALSPEEKMGVEDPMEMEKLADALPVERAASRWIVCDAVEPLIEALRPYVDLGFRNLVFHAPGQDQARFLNLFSEKAMPALRQAFE